MASISWPSVLADVLVSGATIRGRGLQAWWSMNTVPEIPDNVAGTTYVQDAWATADGWTTAETISYPSTGTIKITGSSGAGYIAFEKNITYTSKKNIRARIRTSKTTVSAYWQQSISSTGYYTFFGEITNDFKTIQIIESQAGTTTTVYFVFPTFGNGDWIEIDFIYIGTGAYDILLKDNSGNGKDSTILNCVPVDGVSSKALLLNGVDSNCSTSLAITIPSDGFTLCANVNLISFTASNYNMIISASGLNYFIGIYNGYPIFSIVDIDNTQQQILHTSQLTLDTDCFISATHDGTIMKLYIDGFLVASKVCSLKNVSSIYVLGSYDTSSLLLDGTIDEARIYDRALSADEVLYLYNNTTTYEPLPEYPDYDGFGEVPQNGTIRSTVDSGPPKVRRRFTALTTIYNVQYQLTQNQKQLLDYFYRTTTAQGSLAFNFEVPDGNTVEARFLTQPSFSAQEQGAIASFQIEVLP